MTNSRLPINMTILTGLLNVHVDASTNWVSTKVKVNVVKIINKLIKFNGNFTLIQPILWLI